MPYERELEAALEAVDRAGRAVLEQYARFEVIPDAPVTITTAADHEAQEMILGHLHQVFPHDALCAEETTATLAQVPRQGPRLWIVDPIDGTRGFARKNGEFSLMIAFVEQGRVVVGVVLEPARGRLTYAVRSGGCWQRDGAAATAVPCRVSGVGTLAQATLTQSRSREPGRATQAVKQLQPARVIETYSAGIKLALVARGEADVYVPTYFHDWDICAGHILVAEAGGRVTNLTGKEITYDLPGASQCRGMGASNGLLHDALLAALQKW